MAVPNSISFQTVKDICDVVSLIIACPEDSTFLLAAEPSSELWVLSIKNNTNVSWRECARRLFKEVYLNEAPELMRMVRMNKVWIPDNSPSTVFHVVYEIKCNSETKRRLKLANGRFRTRARWVTKSEVQKFSAHNGLRSPEIIQYITLVESDVVKTTTKDSKPLSDASQTLQEMESSDNYFVDELTEMSLAVPDGPFAELVNAANFHKEDQHMIFREFLMNCFPALYMSESCFEKFLLDCGWNKADIARLFIAADVYNRGALSYKDFLYVLAATDPTTPHGGAPAEIRCRYIFRFYDKNKTNVMDPIQFRELVETMRRTKKLSLDVTSVNKEIEWHAKQIGVDKDTPLGLGEFLQAVGELKLRGTSVLLRCSKDYMSIIKDWQEREKVKPNRQPVVVAKPSLSLPAAAVSASAIPPVNPRALKQIRQPPNQPGSRNPQASQTMDYELGMHCIKLKKFGAIVDVEQLVEMEGASVTPSTTLPYKDAKNTARVLSMEMFSKKSQASELLTGLRYFVAYISGRDTKKVNQGHRASKVAYSWGPVDPLGFANCLIQISNLVRECFNEESRLLNLQSPVYVMETNRSISQEVSYKMEEMKAKYESNMKKIKKRILRCLGSICDDNVRSGKPKRNENDVRRVRSEGSTNHKTDKGRDLQFGNLGNQLGENFSDIINKIMNGTQMTVLPPSSCDKGTIYREIEGHQLYQQLFGPEEATPEVYATHRACDEHPPRPPEGEDDSGDDNMYSTQDEDSTDDYLSVKTEDIIKEIEILNKILESAKEELSKSKEDVRSPLNDPLYEMQGFHNFFNDLLSIDAKLDDDDDLLERADIDDVSKYKEDSRVRYFTDEEIYEDDFESSLPEESDEEVIKHRNRGKDGGTEYYSVRSTHTSLNSDEFTNTKAKEAEEPEPEPVDEGTQEEESCDVTTETKLGDKFKEGFLNHSDVLDYVNYVIINNFAKTLAEDVIKRNYCIKANLADEELDTKAQNIANKIDKIDEKVESLNHITDVAKGVLQKKFNKFHKTFSKEIVIIDEELQGINIKTIDIQNKIEKIDEKVENLDHKVEKLDEIYVKIDEKVKLVNDNVSNLEMEFSAVKKPERNSSSSSSSNPRNSGSADSMRTVMLFEDKKILENVCADGSDTALTRERVTGLLSPSQSSSKETVINPRPEIAETCEDVSDKNLNEINKRILEEIAKFENDEKRKSKSCELGESDDGGAIFKTFTVNGDPSLEFLGAIGVTSDEERTKTTSSLSSLTESDITNEDNKSGYANSFDSDDTIKNDDEDEVVRNIQELMFPKNLLKMEEKFYMTNYDFDSLTSSDDAIKKKLSTIYECDSKNESSQLSSQDEKSVTMNQEKEIDKKSKMLDTVLELSKCVTEKLDFIFDNAENSEDDTKLINQPGFDVREVFSRNQRKEVKNETINFILNINRSESNDSSKEESIQTFQESLESSESSPEANNFLDKTPTVSNHNFTQVVDGDKAEPPKLSSSKAGIVENIRNSSENIKYLIDLINTFNDDASTSDEASKNNPKEVPTTEEPVDTNTTPRDHKFDDLINNAILKVIEEVMIDSSAEYVTVTESSSVQTVLAKGVQKEEELEQSVVTEENTLNQQHYRKQILDINKSICLYDYQINAAKNKRKISEGGSKLEQEQEQKVTDEQEEEMTTLLDLVDEDDVEESVLETVSSLEMAASQDSASDTVMNMGPNNCILTDSPSTEYINNLKKTLDANLFKMLPKKSVAHLGKRRKLMERSTLFTKGVKNRVKNFKSDISIGKTRKIYERPAVKKRIGKANRDSVFVGEIEACAKKVKEATKKVGDFNDDGITHQDIVDFIKFVKKNKTSIINKLREENFDSSVSDGKCFKSSDLGDDKIFKYIFKTLKESNKFNSYFRSRYERKFTTENTVSSSEDLSDDNNVRITHREVIRTKTFPKRSKTKTKCAMGTTSFVNKCASKSPRRKCLDNYCASSTSNSSLNTLRSNRSKVNFMKNKNARKLANYYGQVRVYASFKSDHKYKNRQIRELGHALERTYGDTKSGQWGGSSSKVDNAL